VDIAKETLKYYWFEMVTRGISCNEKKCVSKKVSIAGKRLELPYPVGNLLLSSVVE